eukprot:Tbor_TRINITY_DN3726_c1_g1::TRINITY_DN3726_c1_g1_i1::g.2453::m.2453
MPPKSANPKDKNAKSKKAVLNMAVEMHADVDMKRLLEAAALQPCDMEPFTVFLKRIKQEVQLVKDGDQLETPNIPLVISGCRLEYSSVKGLFSVLVNFHWLRHIHLYHCKIRDDGAMIIADFLKSYNPLKEKNPFGIETLELPDSEIGPQGALFLGRVLAQNQTIKILNLDFNPLGDEGAANLGDGLKWNSVLERLSLNYCKIGAIGGECIGKFIVKCSSVLTLSLKGNALGPIGITHIGHALATNAYLTKIDLSDTGFGVDLEAIEALRNGIESNDSLEAVDINLNSLVPTGMQMLLEVVRAKPKLVQFVVYERINVELFNEMLDAVANNVKLMKKKKKKKVV